MNIRKANNADKNIVLNFCKSTFKWGDYIDKVWDSWLNDSSGLLLVSDRYDEFNRKSFPIALSHISECPKNILWIEGIRVNQIYRNQGVASSLINYMINIGIKKGFREASAIVSKSNIPSQKMFEKEGFLKVFEINSYDIDIEKSTVHKDLKMKLQDEIKIKTPDTQDITSIIKYIEEITILNQSKIIYFNSWKFYELENNYNNLFPLIKDNKILLFVDQFNNIKGFAIINFIYEEESGLHKKKTVQVCHLDCIHKSDYSKVIDILINTYLEKSFTNIQFYISYFIDIDKNLYKEKIKYFEQFFLYKKKINNHIN